MTKTIPLSNLVQRPTEVASLAAEQDVILGRRNADDLYLSTRERHEREAEGLRITTVALASLAGSRPDLAGDALTASLPWMVWLPADQKVLCLQELLDDLRAGAATGELRPFFLNLAAWESTAVAWSDPELAHVLRREAGTEEMSFEDSLIPHPGAETTGR
jgi:hypothetical protein